MNAIIISHIPLNEINNFLQINTNSIIIGLSCSLIVGLIIYKKQKKESAKSQKELLIAISSKSNNHEESVESISDLKKKYAMLNSQLNNLIKNRDYTRIHLVSGKYIFTANQIANRTQLGEFNTENLTIKNICSLHKKMFPINYPIAGKLRNIDVAIAGAMDYVPPQHKNVYRLLNNLLKEWNSEFKLLVKSTEKDKIKKIAKFHHRLLSIHPFIDGNGRLARIIMEKQIEKIFNKELKIDLKRAEYMEALKYADKNDFNKLELIIKKSLYQN